jgi:hypothetical protein
MISCLMVVVALTQLIRHTILITGWHLIRSERNELRGYAKIDARCPCWTPNISSKELCMESNSIDASVGLGFSLELFKKYKRSGVLQATVRRFPGLRGPQFVSIYLVDGAVVSCSMVDEWGQRTPVLKDVIVHLDRLRGPFEWVFHHTYGTQTSPSLSGVVPYARYTTSDLSKLSNAAVSRAVSTLPGERLLSWPIQQRRMFLLVWQQIKGRRSVVEIKAALRRSLPAVTVEEILQVLINLSFVALNA